ncbi:MAG: hypothetical protein HOP15_00975 [Planctomycetes bacterium]|nr:hypothetical protein [Planctomycetota bacterium]
MKSRIIPGAVTPTSLRGLLMTDGTASLENQGVPVPLTALPGSESFARELAKHGITLHAFEITVPAQKTLVELRAPGSPVVRVRTLETNPDQVTFIVASCYYDGFHQDRRYLAGLAYKGLGTPAFKLLVGDNLYMDVTPDEKTVWGGYPETIRNYVRYFWRSGYGDVLSTLPTFTTWDDHEFWNNFPEDQCHLQRTTKRYRDEYTRAGRECLDLFQATLNPPAKSGRSYEFSSGRLSFFVADIRSNRKERKSGSDSMFSEPELQALEAWAKTPDVAKVLVLGQPLWSKDGGSSDYNPPDFGRQYARIWDAVARAPGKMVVISGDVHHSRLLEISTTAGSVLEFVSSPACHIPTVATIPFGGWKQGEGSIDLPGKLKLGNGLNPKIVRYFFGTNARNSIGVLSFGNLNQGPVKVSAAFLDLESASASPPISMNASIEGAEHEPEIGVCKGMDLFKMG